MTGSGGTASNRLGDLFSKGTGTWSFTPTINVPLFAGGRNRANLDLAHIEKNMAVARYELTIQTVFREVSDALNARETYRDQRNSQQALVAAEDHDADAIVEMEKLTYCLPCHTQPLAEKPMYIRHTATMGMTAP